MPGTLLILGSEDIMVNKRGKVAALAECHLAGMGKRRQQQTSKELAG